MGFKVFGDSCIVSIPKGEEVMKYLTKICEHENIRFGSISAIGAIDNITLGYFEPQTKEYHTRTFTGSHELANLTGNITTLDGKVCLHCHVTVAPRDMHAVAGHLINGNVSAVFEVVIRKIDGSVERKHDPQVGLRVMDM